MQQRLAGLEDREAIRQLHLAFTALLESGAYEAAAELFDEQAQLQLSGVCATGKPAIRLLFADQYRQQQAKDLVIAELKNKGFTPERIMLSLERNMRCGVGKCGHCSIEHLQCCTDGPVFRLDQVEGVRGAL